jgi:hypothetical protein
MFVRVGMRDKSYKIISRLGGEGIDECTLWFSFAQQISPLILQFNDCGLRRSATAT